MRLAGLVLGLELAVGSCGGESADPAALPSPDAVVHLLSQGNRRNVAVTSDGAADPRLRPHVFPVTPVEGAHAVVDALEHRPRWEIVAGRDGVIWATHRSGLFSLVNDVYLLLLPTHDSTVIFARSASRTGTIDFGQNRRTLAELWEAVEQQVNTKRSTQ